MAPRKSEPPAPVVERLRTDILRGDLHPGERLVELQLAEHYDVGRAAIRAALVELDAQGLVTRTENRGATVRRISVATAIEITEARAALEGFVARRAAERATKAEHRELRAIVTEMERSVKNDDLAAYAGCNRRLHESLAAISRHEIATELIDNLRNRAAHHQYRLALVAGRPAESLPEHQAVVKAVISGDGDQAEAAMRAHLDSVIEVLRRWDELGTPS